jgi:chemotaxis protein methyltransferase CheR
VHRKNITFLHQDVRTDMPEGPFDLVFCRNLVFTYFAPALQQTILARIGERLAPQGYLVIGAKEHLPPDAVSFVAMRGLPAVFQSGMRAEDFGADASG